MSINLYYFKIGIKGFPDRFGQIRPKVLFTANGYWFKGKSLDSMKRISNILAGLPEIEKVVIVPYTDQNPDLDGIPNRVL